MPGSYFSRKVEHPQKRIHDLRGSLKTRPLRGRCKSVESTRLWSSYSPDERRYCSQ
jgi:hypothetical protein